MKKANYILHFFLTLFPFILNAQSIERFVISTSGENLSGGNYTLEYTFGEVVAQTFEQTAQLSQGFHQVWAITTSVSNENTEDWQVNVFPNPTIGLLNVDTKEALNARIINTSGQLVVENKIEPADGNIDMTNLPVGTYFLLLNHRQGAKIKTYKIVKIF